MNTSRFRKYVKVTFIGLIICLAAIGCKKSSEDPEAHISFDREGLKFIQIPLNRYFIYKDSATGNLDSVIVTESVLEQLYSPKSDGSGGFPNWGKRPGYHYEKFSIELTKFSGTNQSTWLEGKTSGIFYIYESNDHTPIRLEDSNFFIVFRYDPTTTTTTVIPSIVIEGKVYNQVISTTDSRNGTLSTYYWAKGIGIIKREIQTSTSTTTHLLLRNGEN